MNMNVAQRLILGEQTISHVQSNDKLTAWMAGGIQKQLTWKETPVWGGIWWFIFDMYTGAHPRRQTEAGEVQNQAHVLII